MININKRDLSLQLLSALTTLANFIFYIIYLKKYSIQNEAQSVLSIFTFFQGISGTLSGVITFTYVGYAATTKHIHYLTKSINISTTILLISWSVISILLMPWTTFSDATLKLHHIVYGVLYSIMLSWIAILVQFDILESRYLRAYFIQFCYSSLLVISLLLFTNYPVQIINMSLICSFIVYVIFNRGDSQEALREHTWRAMVVEGFKFYRQSLVFIPGIMIFSLGAFLDPIIVAYLSDQQYGAYIISYKIMVSLSTIIGSGLVAVAANDIGNSITPEAATKAFHDSIRRLSSNTIPVLLIIELVIYIVYRSSANYFAQYGVDKELLVGLAIIVPGFYLTTYYGIFTRLAIRLNYYRFLSLGVLIWATTYLLLSKILIVLQVKYILFCSFITAWLIVILMVIFYMFRKTLNIENK